MTPDKPKLATAAITIQADAPRAINSDLFGIFFEDLNYAADGGLYAELIQNRSFEYQATEQPTWNQLSFWELVTRGDGRGHLGVGDALPIHPHNPHYAVLEIHETGNGVGLANGGFDGIPVWEGAIYDVSLFARQLYMNGRWGSDSAIAGHPMPLTARLERVDGEVLGETSLVVSGAHWQRITGKITATGSDANARFVLLAGARGGITLDDVSLFPRETFRNRRNGLRADLAQVIADLEPRFVRFPGGCLAHGWSLGNMYRWKDTLGPVEQRRQQANLWGYHQTMGLGYFEYFQFCEDIGAKPVPVVPAGVTCQNACHVAGIGQQAIPREDMSAYVQEVLDLIEWANGPVTSTWGAKRAEAGHPEPFGLEYLGVGNEDHITPEFEERFRMIHEALRAKHPEITVIGTTGPFHSGSDYDAGWKIARDLRLAMVDEHFYEKPDWFWDNLGRYDAYDRAESKVYLGEFAAHEKDRTSTLRSALAEAAFMTALERNGDVVSLASYAPLLARRGHTQWVPDLIYFDNTTVSPTINYQVQRLFRQNAGDVHLPTEVLFPSDTPLLTASCVRDTDRGDLILKIVSRADISVLARIELPAGETMPSEATCTVLTGEPLAENHFGEAPAVLPRTSRLSVDTSFAHEVPPHSLTIIRIKAQAETP